jgi:hypothetical protein
MTKTIISILAVIALTACSAPKNTSMGGFIATMEVKEPIPGVCDNSKVIAILPFEGNGQIKAEAPMSDEELTEILNNDVAFLKENPDVNDEGMVNLIINCEGKMVRCQIDNKTQNPELDEQIVDVFSKMIHWKVGTVNGKPVDTVVLYSFEIKDGVLTI